MASRLNISWQLEGENVEAVRFPLPGLQNHCGWCCSHEIRRRLLLGRKSMTNLDSVLKRRDITLLTKNHIIKAMATHSSTLAWKTPWMKEAGRLQSMGSLRVGHD